VIDASTTQSVWDDPHRDPFDRVLIAQAQARSLLIVSTDTVFDRYGVQRIW